MIAAVGGLTYQNFVSGPDAYNSFLESRGVEADAAVISVKKSSSVFAEGSDEIEITVQEESGAVIEMSFTSHDRRFYPPVETPTVAPENGDRIRIRYFPGAETGFIVLSDPKKSFYGGKIACADAKKIMAATEKANRFNDFNPDARKRYRKAIEQALALSCLDYQETERLRGLLPKL